MNQNSVIRFREEQVFRAWWLWGIVGGVAGLQWWGFVHQIVRGEPWGNRPAPDWVLVVTWIVFGLGLPLFFIFNKLTVIVTSSAVEIGFRPLTRRTIALDEISAVEARRYAPLREYGGWGIRTTFSGKRAYNVSGDEGVELTLTDGRKVMLGSQRSLELAQAIEEARNR